MNVRATVERLGRTHVGKSWWVDLAEALVQEFEPVVAERDALKVRLAELAPEEEWRDLFLRERAKAQRLLRDQVDPDDIHTQRAAGWPDFHPETYCHRCGRRNIVSWFSPEWVELTGSHAGILCPVCFADADPNALWTVTRHHEPDADAVALLATTLRALAPDLGEDYERVASCLIDAGWARAALDRGTP